MGCLPTPILFSLKGCCLVVVVDAALDDVLNCLMVRVRDPRLWHCFLKAAVESSDRNGVLATPAGAKLLISEVSKVTYM